MAEVREKRLFKNTGIYFIGNFGSKILNIILVPVYMIYLNSDSFGTVDLLLLLSSMIALFVTLDMTDAVYRFMFDAQTNEQRCIVITNAIITYIVGTAIFMLIYIGVLQGISWQYTYLFAFHIFFANFGQFVMQLCRGMRYNMQYSIAGCLLTIVQGCTNIALIVFFNMGENSLLIAPVVSSMIVIVYLSKTTKFYKWIKLCYINKAFCEKMAKYSMPMFIQVLLLWIIQNSGTYFLTFYLNDTSESGIYAMATKFPMIISSLASIFVLAWQESAIMSKNDKDASEYYRKIYSFYFEVLVIVTCIILPLLKIYFNKIGNSSYETVWIYVPAFIIIAIISSLGNFVGAHFIAEKDTMQVVKTLIFPATITTILNILLIPKFKMYGLIVGQFWGYFLMLMMRKKITKKLYKVIWQKRNIMLIISIGIIIPTYYIINSITLLLIILSLIGVLFIYLYKNLLKKIIVNIRGYLCSPKRN